MGHGPNRCQRASFLVAHRKGSLPFCWSLTVRVRFPLLVAHRKGSLQEAAASSSPAGPRGFASVLSRTRKGGTHGRPSGRLLYVWLASRPPMRGDILASTAPPYHSSRTGRHCPGAPECHWVFQPRREPPTPDCGFVTPTAQLGPFPVARGTSSGLSMPTRIYQAPLPSSHGEPVSSPCVPLRKEQARVYERGRGRG